MKAWLWAIACFLCSSAQAQPVMPKIMEGLEIEEHLGQKIPLDLEFTDSLGKKRSLSEFVGGEKPLLLVLAYYRCPALCNLVLNGVVNSLHQLDWKPQQQFRVITISFDAREDSYDASRKQGDVLAELGLPDDREIWPFLVGEPDAIETLTQSLGFPFTYDEDTEQIAHAAVIFAITPEGIISRYLYGVAYPPQDMKLALLEASEGKTGSFFEKFLMICFHYDPATRRYGLYIQGFLRVGALLIFLVVGFWVYRLWRREQEEHNE